MKTAHESSQLHLEGVVFGATAFKLCLHHFLVGRLEARDAPSPPGCPSVEQRRIKVVSSLGGAMRVNLRVQRSERLSSE